MKFGLLSGAKELVPSAGVSDTDGLNTLWKAIRGLEPGWLQFSDATGYGWGHTFFPFVLTNPNQWLNYVGSQNERKKIHMKFPSNHTSSDPLANQPTSSSLNADHEIEYLKMQVERLFMISEALWEFIKEKNGLEDSELFRMVMDIDAKDGRIDGKVAPQPTQCPECNHVLPRTKPFCLYCGTYVVKKVFEH